MQIPIESREENEELLWRQQYVKETLLLITCSRKRVPNVRYASIYHCSESKPCYTFKLLTLKKTVVQITFPRMNLHRETICAKCKTFHAYNLIKLNCSNEMCDACLLDLIHCNEIETPDDVWEYQFHIRCPFCNYIHRVDSEATAFLYELCELPLPITDAPWI